LGERSYVGDFDRLQPLLAALAGELDHRLLNELDPFRGQSPSAERQAEFFYQRLSAVIERELGSRVRLAKVRVTQEPGSWAEYEP
jgi:6-pyruvoyltetrahydropterin/6-carboxytetrahydropterin synthase